MNSKKLAQASTWAWTLTPRRAVEFDNGVCAMIEKTGVAWKNRQMGNIINDLRIRGEHSVIEEINIAVDGYNAFVDRHNEKVDADNRFYAAIARYRKTDAYYDALSMAKMCGENEDPVSVFNYWYSRYSR